MLRLFRKLRQRVLLQNNFTRYIVYALGEIVLIVIGILIALGINNWNKNNQAKDREAFYLSGLQTEFERSKTKLKTLIEVNQLNYNEAKKIASFITEETPLTEAQLSELLFQSFSYEIAYNPNNSLLNELIGSGGLQDISSPQLRKHLTNWESQIQSVNRQEATLRAQREKVLEVFSANQGNVRTILDLSGVSEQVMHLKPTENHASNLKVVKNQEFENQLLMFILTGVATETSHYNPLMQEIDTLLNLIETEKDKQS